MMTSMISSILGMSLLCLSHLGFCDTATRFLTLEDHHLNSWVVHGLLQNEQQDAYGFLFKVERFKQHYHAAAAIYDLNNRQVLWHQAANSTVLSALNQPLLEKIGPFFWHYSVINSSLIIGYQDEQRQIFNLKFDLLEPTSVYHALHPTADLKINEFWSGSINGHMNISHEEFISSSNAWIQNLSQEHDAYQAHTIHELLCKFQDGQSLFALQIPEKNALKASITSLYNANGEKQLVSQFLNLNKPAAQDYRLELGHQNNPLHLHAVFATADYDILHAQDSDNQNQGYCVFLQNPWVLLAKEKSSATLPPKKRSLLEKTIALSKKPFKLAFLLKNKMTS